MSLTGEQYQRLTDLVSEALDEPALEEVVTYSLNKNLFRDLVPNGHKHRHTTFKLLSELDSQGLMARFLKGVMTARPEREDIQKELPELWPAVHNLMPSGTVESSGAGLPQAAGTLGNARLERIIRENNPALDIGRWRGRLCELETRVCRVDIDGSAVGTGFLVGKDLVLTNYHVVADIPEDDTSNLSCLFDHKIQANGRTTPGLRVKLLPSEKILRSPCTDAEFTSTPDAEQPATNQLDFAVLHLNRELGTEPLSGPSSPPRGWEILPKDERALPKMRPDDGIIIAQHPQGEPMKLAIDTRSVIRYNDNRTRLRYRTNTERGSSGSPVYDMQWNLVALHHLGDPATSKATAYNQGVVPLHLIREAIENAGHSLLPESS